MAGITTISTEDVVVRSDEEIWIVGHTGYWSRIVNYNPVTGDWIAYDYETTNGGMPGNDVTSIALAKDGSLWVGLRDNGILHFLPDPNNEQNGTWLHYTMKNGLLAESAYYVSLAPDGFIWFTNGGSSVQRCEEFRFRELELPSNYGG